MFDYDNERDALIGAVQAFHDANHVYAVSDGNGHWRGQSYGCHEVVAVDSLLDAVRSDGRDVATWTHDCPACSAYRGRAEA
jgi:hypothetical protein